MASFQASQLLALARKWLSFCFLLIFRVLSFQGVEGGSAIISESQTTVAAFRRALTALPSWRKLDSYNSHRQRFCLVSETSFKSKIHSHARKAEPSRSLQDPCFKYVHIFVFWPLPFFFFSPPTATSSSLKMVTGEMNCKQNQCCSWKSCSKNKPWRTTGCKNSLLCDLMTSI